MTDDERRKGIQAVWRRHGTGNIMKGVRIDHCHIVLREFCLLFKLDPLTVSFLERNLPWERDEADRKFIESGGMPKCCADNCDKDATEYFDGMYLCEEHWRPIYEKGGAYDHTRR